MADQKISVGTGNPVGIFPVLFKLLDLIFSHRLSTVDTNCPSTYIVSISKTKGTFKKVYAVLR